MIRKIRQLLESTLGQFLKPKLKDGFFVVDSEAKGEIVLSKMALDEGKKDYFLGIIPMFKVTKTGSVSFTQIVAQLIQAARTTFAASLKQVPLTVLKSASNLLVGTGNQRLDQVQIKVAGEAGQLLKKFEDVDLQAFTRTDRNMFRQKLLEELGKQTSGIFAEIAKKHLAELVMRIRNDVMPDDGLDGSNGDKGEFPALPMGTRFCIRKGKMTVFVIEQPPQKRTLKIMEEDGVKSQMYQLSLPYVVFFVVLRGRKSDAMYAFFRKGPLRSLQDELLCVATPNIFENFKVCFSPSAAKPSLAEMAEESVGSFWGGRFVQTHDPGNLIYQIDLGKWAQESKKDSLFGLSYNWRSARRTVAEMLKIISADFDEESRKSQKDKNGTVSMSALEKAVDSIATAIANGMKEKCFNLVPGWNIDGARLERLTAEFKQTLTSLTGLVKVEFGKEVNAVFSDELIKEALEQAVQQAITSMDADQSKPVLAARTALLVEQQRTTNDTNPH
ncbi:MAG: hypothetical protein AAB365_03630 [Patescibacteria group bacterium]